MHPGSPTLFDRLIRPGWEGAKANLLPGLIIQGLILLLLIAYFTSPAVADFLARLSTLRNGYGFVSSFVIGAVGVGLFSEFLKWATTNRSRWQTHSWKYYAFNFLYWGLSSVWVDLFYHVQHHVFGTSLDWRILLLKALADQFLFTMLFANNINCLATTWRDSGFDRARFVAVIRDSYVLKRIAPAFVSNFFFWFPTVLIIYAMPLPLQMPIGALAGIFWVLLLNFVVGRKSD
ncbi:MAG: hypothetical protein SFY92_11715 [Verrucomicrobiae bacterium]|nr:hypothetical protein [Verrucomicrobiae bacterium]